MCSSLSQRRWEYTRRCLVRATVLWQLCGLFSMKMGQEPKRIFRASYPAFCRHGCTTFPRHVAKKSLRQCERFIWICAYARRAAYEYTMIWTRVRGSTQKKIGSPWLRRAQRYLPRSQPLYLSGCVSVCVPVCLWDMVVHTKPSFLWPAITVWHAVDQQQTTGNKETAIDAYIKRRSLRKQCTTTQYHTLTVGANRK